MSTSRPSFIELIQINPEVVTQCRDSSKAELARGTPNRIFDGFPILLPQNKLDNLIKKFEKIFSKIKPITIPDEVDDPAQLLINHDKKKIFIWQREVIKIGCYELLGQNGQIKNEIVELLEWHPYAINICDIVCAYVGAVNQFLADKLNILFKEKGSAFSAICQFVNQNYRKWVLEELAHFSDKPDERDAKVQQSKFIKIKRLPKEKPAVAVGLAVGFTVTLAAIGYALFSSSSTRNPQQNKPGEKPVPKGIGP